MPRRCLNLLTKLIQCQRRHKKYLNLCWSNPSNSKCIFTFVDRTHSMLAKAQNASEHVLIKPFICQLEHKIYLNSCWLNPSHDIIVSQQVLSLSYQRGHKNHLSMCWPISSNASETTKCISNYFDQTHPMPGNT